VLIRGWRSRWGAVAVAAILLAGCDRGSAPRLVDKPAPEFKLNDGKDSVDLAQMRGRVVVLNFWGPWCPACLLELPSLMAMQNGMPQVTVLAIGVPDPEAPSPDAEGDYRRFLTTHHVNLMTVYDGAMRVNQMYGTQQFPETYIIDKRGVLRRKFVGAQVWTSAEISKYLQALSKENS